MEVRISKTAIDNSLYTLLDMAMVTGEPGSFERLYAQSVYDGIYWYIWSARASQDFTRRFINCHVKSLYKSLLKSAQRDCSYMAISKQACKYLKVPC